MKNINNVLFYFLVDELEGGSSSASLSLISVPESCRTCSLVAMVGGGDGSGEVGGDTVLLNTFSVGGKSDDSCCWIHSLLSLRGW